MVEQVDVRDTITATTNTSQHIICGLRRRLDVN